MEAIGLRPEEKRLDEDLLADCTATVQAQERFFLKARNRKGTADSLPNSALVECGEVLDRLRQIRSQLDGTSVTFEVTKVNEAALQNLKQLTLMHVPTSCTPEVKDKFRTCIGDLFEGSCKRVLYASLYTNPWYWATQDERGVQAKHNQLFVVFLSKEDQFYSPVNAHQKEQSDVIDEGWFYATEAAHFAQYLVRGKSRFVELIFQQGAVLYEDESLSRLRECLAQFDMTGWRPFLEQCQGQAVGGVSRKSKSGRMSLRDAATLHDFCESFQLLHLLEMVLSGQNINSCPLVEDQLSEHARDALMLLKQAYQKEGMKYQLLEKLLTWKSDISSKLKKFKTSSPEALLKQVGEWLAQVRAAGQQLVAPPAVPTSERETLTGLMNKIGGPVAKMSPEHIIMITQAGSHLYGLATPQSDVDYVVIYAQPTQEIISACKRSQESFEDRGTKKTFEYGAYEARLFCEMVLKGSVVILELLFADSVEYSSAAWKVLSNHKQLFLTERAILQYFGLIKNNMVLIENKKHIGTSREQKLFYQVFHKLNTLEYFLRGEVPQICCHGDQKDFIMKVRRGPLEGDISRDKLYDLATERIQQLKTDLANRAKRLPENVDYDFMTRWLMAVRGCLR